MYIENKKIEYIYYFILGVIYNSDHKEDDINGKFVGTFGNWLIDHIKKNIDENFTAESLYWYHNIRKITNTDEEAYEKFFELCEEFFNEYKKLLKC